MRQEGLASVLKSPVGFISAQSGGDTNNSSSGSGSDYAHSLSYIFPANFFQLAKVVRVTVIWRASGGAAAPTLVTKLKLGSTSMVTGTATAIANNLADKNWTVQYLLVAEAAPSAGSNVMASVIGSQASGAAPSQHNNISSPTSLATDGALTLTIASLWATAGTGTNTITQEALIIEALN